MCTGRTVHDGNPHTRIILQRRAVNNGRNSHDALINNSFEHLHPCRPGSTLGLLVITPAHMVIIHTAVAHRSLKFRIADDWTRLWALLWSAGVVGFPFIISGRRATPHTCKRAWTGDWRRRFARATRTATVNGDMTIVHGYHYTDTHIT